MYSIVLHYDVFSCSGLWCVVVVTTQILQLRHEELFVYVFVFVLIITRHCSRDLPLFVCDMMKLRWQAEHCIAWAKELFDTLFITDISLLRKVVAAQAQDRARIASPTSSSSTSTSPSHVQAHDHVLSVLQSEVLLGEGVARRLLNNLLWPHYRASSPLKLSALVDLGLTDDQISMIQGAILYTLVTFEEQFVQNIATLIAEHPIDSYDENDSEQKTFFWGKNRKFPRVTDFSPTTAMHRQFMVQMTRILCRTQGIDLSQEVVQRVYTASIDSLIQTLRQKQTRLLGTRHVGQHSVDVLSILLDEAQNRTNTTASNLIISNISSAFTMNAASDITFSPPLIHTPVTQDPSFYLARLREVLTSDTITGGDGQLFELSKFMDIPDVIKTEPFLKVRCQV